MTSTTTRATAHRGDSGVHRENTLPAIRSAVEHGAEFVEFDLQVTSDGAVIVQHDPTLTRLWGVARAVAETTLAEVQALGDADHRPPLFEEVLEVLAGTASTAVIDVTRAEIVSDAVPIVAASEADVVWCGDLDAMRAVRRLDPDARIWLPWAAVTAPTAADLVELGPETVNIPALYATPRFVADVHALGLTVAAWTVDAPGDMRAVRAAGVDQITTNRLSTLQAIISGEDRTMTSESQYARERAVARGLGEWAIEFTRSADPGDIRTKHDAADLVTDVDVAVEQHVREVVAQHFPDYDFVGEEMGGEERPGVPCWYLDPVDGTANFANRMPWTAFSLALVVDGEPVVGVVADPWREDLFDAERGEGARLNGRTLHLESSGGDGDPLQGRIVSTELANQHPWPGMLPMLETFGERFCTMRIMGSGTMTLVGVAAGRGVGAVIGHFGAVDHLAAAIIVSEAGGVVLDESGTPNLFPSEGGIMAATPDAAGALHEVWVRSIAAAGGSLG